MRISVFSALLASAVTGMALISCDLLDNEVLIDDGTKITVTDSTTIRVMSSLTDSTLLVISTEAKWHADVAAGADWCTLSKHDGDKGRDSIYVRVEENSGTTARQTSILVESGNMIKIFRVSQLAAESWHDKPYWNRTAAARMGLHGYVQKITVTDNRHSTESSVYTFDQLGNLLTHQSIDKVANRYDTTRTYAYDNANHRIQCSVMEDAGGQVVRKWQYEYRNTGKLVAFSARGWMDPDPLAEDMEGMIVPDLSASHKTWIEGDVEFHEDKTFTFTENDTRLLIITDRWKLADNERVEMGCDTARVSYQYFNSCKLSLPYTSRGNVTNSAYFVNGMLKMITTTTGSYDYLENSQRLLVASYAYTGPQEAPHRINSFECEYNSNHDLIQRRIRYNGDAEFTVEKYPQYDYDDQHNWVARVEETHKPGIGEAILNASKREILYFRY